MTTRVKRKYLTDITTSEGSLSRYSLICEMISAAKFYDHAAIGRMIAENAGISHIKVVGRHLHILKTIGLIKDTPETYLISSRGKALVKLRSGQAGVLSRAEKTLFFRSFFTSIPEQLYWAIYVVRKNEKATLVKNATEYFYNSPARKIWIRTIERATRRGQDKPDFLPRGMRNKFETMLNWLSQLDILRKRKRIWLTENGVKMLETFPRNVRQLPEKIYEMASLLHAPKVIQHFRMEEQKDTLVKALREGSRLFRGEQNLSDLIAIQEFVSAVFATDGIVLEEKSFYDMIQELWIDGSIKSIILRRNGKPAFLVMD